MAAAIKMDELLVSWLGSDTVYENVQQLMETYQTPPSPKKPSPEEDDTSSQNSPRGVIPPFYPKNGKGRARRMRNMSATPLDTWLPEEESTNEISEANATTCVRDLVETIFAEQGQDPPVLSPSSEGSDTSPNSSNDSKRRYLTQETFGRITKECCKFPSFFNGPLFSRILELWNSRDDDVANMNVVTSEIFEWFWMQEMEPYDAPERFFRLLKQPQNDYIARDDFLPYIKELLNDHPVSAT